MKHLFTHLGLTFALLSALSFNCLGADKYTLEYNLEPGKTYKQNAVTTVTIKMNAMGQDMKMDIKTEMNILYDVKAETDSGYTIQLSYQKIKMDMTGPASMTIDSDSPESSTNQDAGEIFKSIVRTQLEINLTKQGKVTSIQGADQLLEKFNSLSNEQLRQMLSQQFSANAIRESIEKMSPFFPDKPVAVGDNWDVNSTINSGGFDIISKMNLTLKEVKDNIATIDYIGIIATPEGGSLIKVNGMDAKIVSMQGDQKGTILLDMKTGWINNMESIVNNKQNIEIMGQSIAQEMETKVTVIGE